ncbi:hypothetical protein D3C78_1606380 [compost metagenome]
MGEDPVLDIQDFVLRGFLRQVLNHLAHVHQPQAFFILGQLIAQDQARPITEPVEQQQQRNRIPALGQLRRRLLLLEQFLHPIDHLRALLAHALGLQVDGGQR